MRIFRPAGMSALMLLIAATALSQPQAITFDGAKWIWSPMSDPAGNPNDYLAGSVYFRASVELPAAAKIQSAQIIITCDNLFVLFVNGKPVGESDADNSAWGKPRKYDIAPLLVPGRNVFAVHGVNTLPGPSGLIAKCIIQTDAPKPIVLVTDAQWKCSDQEAKNWHAPQFDDNGWTPSHLIADFGARPWGKPAPKGDPLKAGQPIGKVHEMATAIKEGRFGNTAAVAVLPPQALKIDTNPPKDFAWPEGLVFLGDDCSLYRPHRGTGTSQDTLNVTIFNPRNSRGFPEHDLPAPMKVGRKLYVIVPAKPGVQPRILHDAGKGAMGSPSVTFDGKFILVSMVKEGEGFFHIYRIPVTGGEPQKLTDGPFHDIDPTEMPDGRIAFTSTRIGYFEEYHNSPSRALFAMNPDGTAIRPITNTIIFDNEAEILPDGRILFIRSDNFFDRGKVETLLHAVHPDGTEGYTEFGLDHGPEYGGRLRAFTCGSPAPMPDGRVAFVSGTGISLGMPGFDQRHWTHLQFEAGDVAATPDGRLLCTVATRAEVDLSAGKQKRNAIEHRYQTIGIVNPDARDGKIVQIFDSPGSPLHSPVYVGARQRPPVLSPRMDVTREGDPNATGVLFCQDARFTRNTTAGWQHVRAVRVLMGKGLTVRSSHAYIVHAGSEVVELGTVPLSADGSFAVEVPADTPIAFQAVDAEGRSELNEMSWIYVRPGEKRGCIGCHQTRQAAPTNPLKIDAMRAAPVRLVGQGQPHRFRGNNPAVTGLMELQFDRFREVASLNRHSETTDPLATGQREIQLHIDQLRGDNPDLRLSAAQRLAIFRDPSAAPALAAALDDKSREVRMAAAMALAMCGNRDSVPPLLEALADKDSLVAQAAFVAIENITGAAQPFNSSAPRSDRRKAAAAWQQWLAENPWDKLEQQLIQRLESNDRDIARRAAVAMGHIGSEPSRIALRQYVAREREKNPYPEWKKTHRSDGTRFNALDPVNPRSLQAAVRALGYLKDAQAIPLLVDTIARHSDPDNSNLFLTEACIEALGRIATPEAETALINAMKGLKDYFYYVGWYGDHSALFACHGSPPHYFSAEALDWMGSTRAAEIIPHLIRSLPTDPDRALFPFNDDAESLVGRIIRRCGKEADVVETCLAILGDPTAKKNPEIEKAIQTTYKAWAGHPDPENRAAHVLSATCRTRAYEPRIRAAFDRYRALPNSDIPRETSSALPNKLPVKNWVCFFLARSLGNLADPASLDSLLAALDPALAEANSGHPNPLSPACLFLHNDLTPCWRAASAWAIGQIGDKRATPILIRTIENLKNAPDTRHACATALARTADETALERMRKLASDYPEFSTRKALRRASITIEQQNPPRAK